MMEKVNKKTETLQDIRFILSEYEKVSQWSFSESSEEDRRKFLSNTSSIHFSDGKLITVTKDAISRFHKLAKMALNKKDYLGWLNYQEVYKALLFNFYKQFILNKTQPSEAKAEKLVTSSLKWVEKSCKENTHYIACRLMYPAKEQQPFNIGPVKFRCAQLFEENIKEKFEAYLSTAISQQDELRRVKNARNYYQQFTWVAEVCVQEFSPEASKNKAILAVTAAVDTLTLIFGASHTEKMCIGGPALPKDIRAHLHLDHLDNLNIETSTSSTSSVTFPDDWLKLFETEEAAPILLGMDKAIKSLINHKQEYPMARKFIDALSWFGQAVREQFSAGKIIKGITALEHFLLLNEFEDKAKTLAKRSASLLNLYTKNPKEVEFYFKKVKKAYDLRSNLVHGSLSPFSVDVEDEVRLTLELVREIILCGLCFFEDKKIFDKLSVDTELIADFDRLVLSCPAPGADMESELLGKYIHTKSGKLYEVIGLAHHSETLEELIVYRALYETEFGADSLWTRPKSMFFEKISHNGELVQRFKKIDAG